MGVFGYSTTAGSNAAVLATSLAEGMARAGLNNAARDALADFAKLLLDIGGAVETAGSGNAYTLTTNSVLPAYGGNVFFLAKSNHTNSGASTMNVDTRGVKDIEKLVAGTATALASGDYPDNHIGIFTYSAAENSLILHNPALAYQPGGTDVAIADGGTGQSTAVAAFNALSPLTTRGDLIRRGAANNERVALGAAATILISDGTDPVWTVPATLAEYRVGTTTKPLGVDQAWASLAEVTLTDAATIAVDLATGIDFTVTLGGNRTLDNPTNVKAGQRGRIRIVQDGTGSRTLAYGTNYEFINAQAPILSTPASSEDILYYDCISATRILASLARAIA